MSVAFEGRAMGRPAGMSDAGHAGQRLAIDLLDQFLDLTDRTPAIDAAFARREDRNARGIIAAVFEPP